jgi:hypothetical protein
MRLPFVVRKATVTADVLTVAVRTRGPGSVGRVP